MMHTSTYAYLIGWYELIVLIGRLGRDPSARCRADSSRPRLKTCVEPDVISWTGNLQPQPKVRASLTMLFPNYAITPPSREALPSIPRYQSFQPFLCLPPRRPHHHLFFLSSALRHSISRSLSDMRSDLADRPFTANCSCACGVLYQSSSAECLCSPWRARVSAESLGSFSGSLPSQLFSSSEC